MNSAIAALSSLDTQCVRALGGWEQILPTLLNSVSSLSGLSGFAYSAVIGSGIKLVASLSFLLKDIKAKKLSKI